MGTYSLPMNWHFTWLLHDMQSAMLVHDAFKAPEQVHYTSSQREQDLLQDQLQQQETKTAVPVEPERPSMPAAELPGKPLAASMDKLTTGRLSTIGEGSDQTPELSDAAAVQLEALPQRQRVRKPTASAAAIKETTSCATPELDKEASTVNTDGEDSAAADSDCDATITEADVPIVSESSAATATQHRMHDRWAGLAERAQTPVKSQMTPAEIAFHLVDAHWKHCADNKFEWSSDRTDPFERYFEVQQSSRDDRSKSAARAQLTIDALWSSMILGVGQLMIGQQELDIQNVMLQLAVWVGLMAAHQLSWSGYGMSALHALAGRSLLAATMTAVTTVMVMAAALAACIPVATLAAVTQYEPFTAMLWHSTTSIFSVQAVALVIWMDAMAEDYCGCRIIRNTVQLSLELTVALVTAVLLIINWITPDCKHEVNQFMHRAPAEAQCAWLAMLLPFDLLEWLQRLWYQVPRLRRWHWQVSAMAVCLIIMTTAATSVGSVWLWLHMQIPVGVSWCLLKQRMFTMMIALAVIAYTSLHTAESSTSDIIDGEQEDVQINTLRTDFHAATIKIWLPDSNKWIDILCDLGAATSVMKASTLGRAATRAGRLTKQFSRLIAANGASIGRVLGRTRVKMQFCKSGPTIEHDVSVVDSSMVPDLLGVDFFDEYGAEISFATKSLTLLVNGEQVEVPFSVEGRSFESKTISNLQLDCKARVTARQRITLLPGFKIAVRADVRTSSRSLHRSQSFIAESKITAEIRAAHEETNDLETGLKKLLGVMRAIPRALVSPVWEEGEKGPSVTLILENRGTEVIDVHPGQELAELTEVQLHEGDSDDMVSLEELKKQGLSPSQMAKAGMDGGILGTDDWRTGKSGKQIVLHVLEHRLAELDAWLEDKELSIEEGLPAEEKRALQAIAFAFSDAFAWSKKPGKMRGVEFNIDFKEPFVTPFKERIRRCSPAESAAQIAEVKKMLECDVIERSNSPWASNVVMVKKKDGSWRFCTDWRRLNGLIRKDSFPLPRIDDSLDKLGGAERCTTCDIGSAFWNVVCKESDRQYTAFNTPLGLMEYKRMGFGLCNSSAVFQRAMQQALGDLTEDTVLLYIDDLCIFSSAEDHVDAIAAVFKRVLHSGATLKLSKCFFGCLSVEFLGHQVKVGKGSDVRPAKCKAIVQIDRPQNAKEIKTFLGMAGFFRKYIPHFAAIAAPLRALEKQVRTISTPIKEEWTTVHQRCFDAVKAALVNASTLAHPDFNKPFLILTDASSKFLSAALIQLDDEGNPQPVAYASTATEPAVKAYGVSDLEGACVVWCTRLWRVYLHGAKFQTVVVTDHSALTTLTSKKEFHSSRLARYALDLSEFDLIIKHKPGRYHFLPDWISRAELIDMEAEGILEREIERLDALHEANSAGLLRQDLDKLRRGTENVAEEVIHSSLEVGTAEKGFADSVIFAAGKAQQDMNDLINRNGVPELRRRRQLLFATAASDSYALEAESDSIRDALLDAAKHPSQSATAPDDPIPSRAAGIYDYICSLVCIVHDTLEAAEDRGEDCAMDGLQSATLAPMIQEAQTLDMFAASMRTYLQSDRKVLPKDEILRIDVLRLCDQYVLDMDGWLRHIDTEASPKLHAPALYVPVGIRGEVLNRIHVESGHAAVNKTYALAKTAFYWPHMYTDTKRLLQFCLQCRTHAPRKSKAVMQGHTMAKRAGQVWVLDILHLQHSTDGDHLLLCMVDVFSRYAMVERLTAATAKEVQLAFQNRIMTLCSPELIITDGGSEFKASFHSSLLEIGVEHHVTTARHAQGHGIVERFNRSFTRTLSHLLKNKTKDHWHLHMAAALVAYNCTPHSSHNFTPMHVFFTTLETALLPSTREHTTEVNRKKASALEMVQTREAMKQAVQENFQKYYERMEGSAQEQRRSSRQLNVGDVVLVFRETGSRLKDKWNDRFDGPFTVIHKLDHNTYRVQRVGSDDRPKIEHIDNLVAAPLLPDAVYLDLEGGAADTAADTIGDPVTLDDDLVTESTSKPDGKKYEVELIAAQDGDNFLVKWKGYDIATWEPKDNLDCARLIKEFFKLSSSQKAALKKATRQSSAELSALTVVCNTHATARFLNIDLSKLGEKDIIAAVCRFAKINPEQLLLVWASPDCSTFSKADATNASRGNEFRDHTLWHRPPKDTVDDKRLKAIEHDGMVQNVLLSLQAMLSVHQHTLFVMENPEGSLRRRPFMIIFQLLLSLARHTVNYCAYGAKFKKATDIWTNFDWQPEGHTGDGRCHNRCPAGVWSHNGSARPTYRHPQVIGGANDRRPQGPYAKCNIPYLLHEEILRAADACHQQKGREGRTIVLELFAGSTSMGTTARDLGFDYIAVDFSKRSKKCFLARHPDGSLIESH